jgi:hypothetical protein
MAEARAVVRIEVEFADGRVMRAVGPDADAIHRAYEGAIVLETIRGRPYRGPTMKLVTPPRKEAPPCA